MKVKTVMLSLSFYLFSMALVAGQEGYFTHPEFQVRANVQDEALYHRSKEDFVAFWTEQALDLEWFEKWDKALIWDPPYARWFESGKLNISYNCLDRHIKAGKGDKVALLWSNESGESRKVTYGELFDEVNKLANVLKAMGVGKGDRVALYMPMVPEAIASMLACTRIGAVHSVIFGGVGAQSVKDRILDAEAKLLITADGSYRAGKKIPYKSLIDPVLSACPSIQNVLVLKHTQTELPWHEGRDHWYHEKMAQVEPYCSPEPVGAEDPLFILYTSGTTGKPKGILHTTGGYLVGVHSTFKWVFDIKPDDIYWCTADIGWITGHSFVVYGPLSNCTTQVIYEGSIEYPSRSQFANIVEKQGVTIFYTAPTLIRMFMKWDESYFKGAQLDSLRLLGSIGEPINPEAWLWYHRLLGRNQCPIVDTWFQTETGALVISPLPGVTPLTPGTVTKALPGYDVDVLDENGNPSPKGFLAIKAPYPSMMRGLYKDHDRYVSTYWSKWGGRYYFAGDAAHKTDDGYFWIDGRSDEVLKVAGHRIGTAEIENALIHHSAISESAVCGVKDDLRGEKIVAFVILKDLHEETIDMEAQLKKVVADYLGSYARPERVVIVHKLPKTRSGKILRRVLKNLIEGKELGNISTLNDPSCMEELIEKCGELYKEFYPDQFFKATLDQISAPCRFGPLSEKKVVMSSAEIVREVTPLLQQHLEETNYDRVHLVEQFLQFCDENWHSSDQTLLSTLANFEPDTNVKKWHGNSCYGLNEDLCARLPEHLQPQQIPAILSKRFQQKGWSQYSHTAVLIAYASPIDPLDEGFILLDPSFDIDEPIVLSRNRGPVLVSMKEKGDSLFSLIATSEGDVIQSQNLTHPEEGDTIYELKQYFNAAKVGVKPMIAADRKISLVSRDKLGTHLGHINVLLDKGLISWSMNYQKQEPFTFEEMLYQGKGFSEEFARSFHISADDLNQAVRNIILHRQVLQQLYKEYLDLLTKTSRVEQFFP